MATRILGEQTWHDQFPEFEALRERTETLLKFRASFEAALKRGPILPAEDAENWASRMSGEAHKFMRQAARLFPDLLGPAAFQAVFPEPEDRTPSQIRASFALRLRVFQRLLSMPGWGVPLALVTSEIEDMDGGDKPTVLMPESRNPGQPKQPTRVARLRLHALCWNSHLKAKGISVGERQGAISTAYRAGWDTIRKWREGCEASFSARTVSDYLNHAANQYWVEYENDEWLPVLQADGAHYYEAWQAQRGQAAG